MKKLDLDVERSRGGATANDEGRQLSLWRDEELEDFRRRLSAGLEFDVARMLQIVAHAGLPRKRRGAEGEVQRLSRTMKMGRDAWVRVSYHSSEGRLPSGPLGRLCLMFLQDSAIRQGSRYVKLGTKTEVLEGMASLWGRDTARSGHAYNRLRKEMHAICRMHIEFSTGSTRQEAEEGFTGGSLPRMVEKFDLSRRRGVEWTVVLDEAFFNELMVFNAQTWVPKGLVKLFSNDDVALDWLMFVLGRSLRSVQPSAVPHSVLMEMFQGPGESPKKTMYKLRDRHEKIMKALGGVLSAQIESVPVRDGNRGRPRTEYQLRVEPIKDRKLLNRLAV